MQPELVAQKFHFFEITGPRDGRGDAEHSVPESLRHQRRRQHHGVKDANQFGSRQQFEAKNNRKKTTQANEGGNQHHPRNWQTELG